jgi:hypothetical protein
MVLGTSQDHAGLPLITRGAFERGILSFKKGEEDVWTYHMFAKTSDPAGMK